MRPYFLLLVLPALLAAPATNVPPEIENPEILGVNKLPYHATLMPYANRVEALAAKRSASSFSRSLNGPWKFHWVPAAGVAARGLLQNRFRCQRLEGHSRPFQLEMQGYGTPYYRNNGYIFQKDWPRVMTEPPQ